MRIAGRCRVFGNTGLLMRMAGGALCVYVLVRVCINMYVCTCVCVLVGIHVTRTYINTFARVHTYITVHLHVPERTRCRVTCCYACSFIRQTACACRRECASNDTSAGTCIRTYIRHTCILRVHVLVVLWHTYDMVACLL